jgi:ABC-type nitrate/sulfonate/bicarbonate transport system substrate-binding protein
MNQQSMPAALESGAIQGFVASAPYWVYPVTKGTGLVWVTGPKGEIPPEFSPTTASIVQVRRDFAEANRDLVKNVAAAFADFAKAVEERPADVKAAIAKSFPEVDRQTADAFFDLESTAWTGKPLTAPEMVREIEFMKLTGASLPPMDKLNPASMIFP